VQTAAIVAAVVLTASACNSSGGKNAGSGGSTGGGGNANKSVIKIGSEMPLSGPLLVVPQLKAGITAAVNAINAAGGLDGHPLELTTCDTQYNTNKELTCMRQLIDDKVSAVVGPLILNDATGREYQLSKAADVPIVGSLGLTEIEYNSPGVFPLVGGIPSWYYGAVEHLLGVGSQRLSFLGESTPGAVLSGQLTEAAIKAAGMTPTAIVNTDTTADPTFAVGAAKATSNGVDGVVIGTNPQFVPKAVLALKTAGYKGPISTISSIVPPPLIKALGSAGDGLLVTSDVSLVSDTKNPAVAEFVDAMKKYQPSASLEELSMDGWAATQLLVKVAGANTRGADIMKAFDNLSGSVDLGVMGPWSTPKSPPYLSKFPRIYNAFVENGTLRNGVIDPDGKGFVNPFTKLASHSGG
jgi:ABC-type branched-subunit amino acid transport system substrate-binding protein